MADGDLVDELARSLGVRLSGEGFTRRGMTIACILPTGLRVKVSLRRWLTTQDSVQVGALVTVELRLGRNPGNNASFTDLISDDFRRPDRPNEMFTLERADGNSIQRACAAIADSTLMWLGRARAGDLMVEPEALDAGHAVWICVTAEQWSFLWELLKDGPPPGAVEAAESVPRTFDPAVGPPPMAEAGMNGIIERLRQEFRPDLAPFVPDFPRWLQRP